MSKGTPVLLSAAQELATRFATIYLGDTFEICGSIRRKEPTVHDIDIATTRKIIEIKTDLENDKIKITRSGSVTVYAEYRGVAVNVYHFHPQHFGAMVFYLTGPASYVIGYRQLAKAIGWKLTQYGLENEKGEIIAGKTEKSIYKALKRSWKDPTQR